MAVYEAPLVAAAEKVALEQVSAVILGVLTVVTSSLLQAWKIENKFMNTPMPKILLLFILVFILLKNEFDNIIDNSC